MTTASSEKMFRTVSRYMAACSAADTETIASCLSSNAVHYFPGWSPIRGAKKIANFWAKLVREEGSQWTVDNFLAGEGGAVIEWTHFRTKRGHVLRGAEWYTFDKDGKIAELKAYYAAPRDPSASTLQLEGFPYRRRGYPMHVPQGTTGPPGMKGSNVHEAHGRRERPRSGT